MQKETKQKSSIFDNFTRKYSLSKTLRFELVPTEKTKELLKRNNIFEKDEKVEKSYQEIKPLFDNLHREFVREALGHDKVDSAVFREFDTTYKQITSKVKKDWKEVREAKAKIHKYVARLLNDTGNEWKNRYGRSSFKADGYKVLTDAYILKVLEKRHPDKKDLVESFHGFFTYFSGFNDNRENFYKDDGSATTIGARVADNFILFIQNVSDFKKYYIPNSTELELIEDTIKYFNIEAYVKVLLQEDIEKHNKVIGELNRRMKMQRDAHTGEPDFKKSNYPLLRALQNQILGEREKSLRFEQIKDEGDAKSRLKELVKDTDEHFSLLKDLFKAISGGSFTAEEESGIYLNNRAINT
ncbi:MAG: hypothetical protein NUV54_00925, partial [Candidatus Taylorbacteria bacterium]|nr:hypothetical protein [Candidatus Taylorbacteria bacterium]